MKYKVIKNFEVTYLPNNIFKGQERIPLMDVKGGSSLKFEIDDIIEFSDNDNDKFVKLNGRLIDKYHKPGVEEPTYYVKEGILEVIDLKHE